MYHEPFLRSNRGRTDHHVAKAQGVRENDYGDFLRCRGR